MMIGEYCYSLLWWHGCLDFSCYGYTRYMLEEVDSSKYICIAHVAWSNEIMHVQYIFILLYDPVFKFKSCLTHFLMDNSVYSWFTQKLVKIGYMQFQLVAIILRFHASIIIRQFALADKSKSICTCSFHCKRIMFMLSSH